jgi:hypothetical protein
MRATEAVTGITWPLFSLSFITLMYFIASSFTGGIRNSSTVLQVQRSTYTLAGDT